MLTVVEPCVELNETELFVDTVESSFIKLGVSDGADDVVASDGADEVVASDGADEVGASDGADEVGASDGLSVLVSTATILGEDDAILAPDGPRLGPTLGLADAKSVAPTDGSILTEPVGSIDGPAEKAILGFNEGVNDGFSDGGELTVGASEIDGANDGCGETVGAELIVGPALETAEG